MTIRCASFFALLALCASGSPLEAAPSFVSSFEAEISAEGWSTAGDVSRQGGGFGVAPTDGASHALLTTASDDGDLHSVSGVDAVGAGDLESFLGLAAGTLGGRGAVEGSALRRTITAGAGDVLSFDYNFLTTEANLPPDYNDFAFAVIQSLAILSDSAEALALSVGSAADLDPVFGDLTFETGYRTFRYTFQTSGDFLLGIGVVDHADNFGPSGLLIDNVQLTPVPEPSALLLGLFGLATAAGYRIARRGRTATGTARG